MTPPINSVSDEVLAELLAYEGDLYLSRAAQPHIRSILTELAARRAANTPVDGVAWEQAARTFLSDDDFEALHSLAVAFAEDQAAGVDTSLKPASAAEPVAWVTADILAAMKRGDRAVPGWKRSDDFCIPLYAGHPAPSASREVTDDLRLAFRNADESDWKHLFAVLPDTGRGRFWKSVLTEARAALLAALPEREGT